MKGFYQTVQKRDEYVGKSVVSKETDTQVFSFSGGLGWVSEPMTDGFLQYQLMISIKSNLM